MMVKGGRQLSFIRVFSTDRDVKKPQFNRFSDAVTGSDEDDEIKPRVYRERDELDSKVPESDRQRVVEDSAHVSRVLRPRSLLGLIADKISDLSSDYEFRMTEPTGVTTDSRQRVIVTDPPAHAVNVYDFRNKKYFRIQGGEGRRLQSPRGVAVDAEDNIYVSDTHLGMILVYDPQGGFLRYIGKHQEGGDYDTPSGLAIDREEGHIYVVDTPRHLIFMLDLQGNLLATFGKRGGDAKEPGVFKIPTDVVLSGKELVVEDANNCRIQILDLQGNFRKQFATSATSCGHAADSSGLGVDEEGNIYVAGQSVSVYSHDGKILYSFGPAGSKRGEFRNPRGIWFGADNVLHVADTKNGRVQVFQLRDANK